MPTIQEVRQKYPQYQDLSDDQLAQGLHKKYYSDMPFEQFSQKIGYAPAAQNEPPEEPEGFVAGLTREITNPGESLSPKNVARAAVTTSRDYLEGVASVLGLPVDAVMSIWNLATGRNDPNFSQTVSGALDSAGVPQTENPYIRGINRSVAGAGGSIGIGRQLAGGASEVTRGVGTTLAADPARQAAGAVTGATSAQLAADAGLGPVGQTIAGVAGGAVGAGVIRPTVAEGVKRAFRGGEAGRQRVAENIQAFDEAGTAASVGQAAENRRMQAAESLLSRAPGGAGVMARTAEQQADDIGANISRVAGGLAPKASAEQAGRAISRGISDQGGFLDTFKTKSAQLYSEIDRFVKPDTPVTVSNTQKALTELTKPIKGAEATSQRFINSRISAMAEDLDVDLQNAPSGQLPYEALKRLRTMVGEELADAPLKGDVPASQWKRLYGALSKDLEEAAKAGGPGAERAYTRASNYYRAGSRRMETIESVLDRNGGPEAVFRAATAGTKEGATTLRAVMQSLPQDGQKTVTATVLRRLGRAKAGSQDDLGERFSTETFLTNWNSMAPEAKVVLFDRFGPQFRRDMDQVAKVASNLREGSAVFRNPSGTAQAAIQYTTAGAFALAALRGDVATAGTIAGGVAASNLGARLLTHPPFVRWLAKTTAKPVAALPAALNQLAQSEDPVLQEAAEFLAQHQPDNSDNQGNRRQQEGNAGQ